MTSSKVIPKNILTHPDVDEIMEAAGGNHQVIRGIVLNAKKLFLRWEKRLFNSKEEYRNLPIYQRALMLLSETRDRVLAVVRASEEVKAGETVERKTSGGSVLLSHSPHTDLQKIMDAKVQVEGNLVIQSPRRHPELVAVNRFTKGTYVFGVSAIRIDLERILGGTDPDKLTQSVPVDEAMALLEDKPMEQNFLSAALN